MIDTGAKQIVYVESKPGVFDGTLVQLGPRSGNYYAVVRGLRAGQRVATAGAFLIDAETRLNPAAAATYFGAARQSASRRRRPWSQTMIELLQIARSPARKPVVPSPSGRGPGVEGR